MSDHKIEPLQSQSPPHKSLVLVLHPVKERQSVVISPNFDGESSGAKVNIKLLQGMQHTQGFLLDG